MRIHFLFALALLAGGDLLKADGRLMANLTAEGTVLTNSAALPSGTTVYAGDKITTDERSRALLASPSAGRIEVRSGTQVTLQDAEIVLHSGVVATDRLPVRVGAYKVSPADAPQDGSLVVVAYRDGQQLVAAHQGNAVIQAEGEPAVIVPAGSYARPSAPDREQGEAGEPTAMAKAAAVGSSPPVTLDSPPAAGPTRPGAQATQSRWAIGRLAPGANIAAAASSGGAAFGASVAAQALSDPPPSPSGQIGQ